jgi:hypothetical protein
METKPMRQKYADNIVFVDEIFFLTLASTSSLSRALIWRWLLFQKIQVLPSVIKYFCCLAALLSCYLAALIQNRSSFGTRIAKESFYPSVVALKTAAESNAPDRTSARGLPIIGELLFSE